MDEIKAPPRRLIKFPGMRDLENDLVGAMSDEWAQKRCDAVFLKVFGITSDDTKYVPPSSYFDGTMSQEDRWGEDDRFNENEERYLTTEMKWNEDRAEYLKTIGWDVYDDRGLPTRLTKYICRVLEAVTKGYAGTMPEGEVIDVLEWERQMQLEANKFRRSKREAS